MYFVKCLETEDAPRFAKLRGVENSAGSSAIWCCVKNTILHITERHLRKLTGKSEVLYMAREHEDFEHIPLGSNGVRVQGENGFFEVDGTHMTSRTTHFITPAREEQLFQRAWQPKPQVLPKGMKWCSSCGYPRPYEMFNKDATRWDGYKYECKDCENPDKAERMRALRRRRAAEEGRDVRKYEFKARKEDCS